MNIPRILIAGTNSGCGKTTISMGIMAALRRRGLTVQPFKVGPDYIDPMFHTFITGRHSRNLDSWMLKPETVSYLFNGNAMGADLAVIEGVMGLYDGYGGYSAEGSTAHIAKITRSPVILVVNGEGLSLSSAALVHGFMDFDRDVDIRGVILNNIRSEQHFQLLKEIIEEHTALKAIGYIPKMKELSLESRHLGLIPSDEVEGLREKTELLALQMEKTINLDLLVRISRDAQSLGIPSDDIELPEYMGKKPKAKIAVAMDKAFNFYYRDNLQLLEMMGAEIVYFSPIKQSKLPDGICGVYLGGGYPEIWAGELEQNRSMRMCIREAINGGLPVYAECGGLMYLSDSIKTRNGEIFGMVGAVPGQSEMTSSLKRFGYVEVEASCDNAISDKGDKIRAHEFHYSVINVDRQIDNCFKVSKNKRNKAPETWNCGFMCNNLVAGYPHLHFWSNKKFARKFVDSCGKYMEEGGHYQ